MKTNNNTYSILMQCKVFVFAFFVSAIGFNFTTEKLDLDDCYSDFSITKTIAKDKEGNFKKNILDVSVEYVIELEESEEDEFESSNHSGSSLYVKKPLHNHFYNWSFSQYLRPIKEHPSVPIYILFHSWKLHCA